MFPYLDVSRVNHLSCSYLVERLEFERMDLGQKGIWRVRPILISFFRYPPHLLPPLRLGLLHRVVPQMTSSLMMDQRMKGLIGYFHTSSADSLNLLISFHPLCITGPYHLRPIASPQRARRTDIQKKSRDLTYS